MNNERNSLCKIVTGLFHENVSVSLSRSIIKYYDINDKSTSKVQFKCIPTKVF